MIQDCKIKHNFIGPMISADGFYVQYKVNEKTSTNQDELNMIG